MSSETNKEKSFAKIVGELVEVKNSIRELEDKVQDLEKDIRTELKLTILPIESDHKEYDRRLSFAEKIIFTTAGFILFAVLGALMTSVIK